MSYREGHWWRNYVLMITRQGHFYSLIKYLIFFLKVLTQLVAKADLVRTGKNTAVNLAAPPFLCHQA